MKLNSELKFKSTIYLLLNTVRNAKAVGKGRAGLIQSALTVNTLTVIDTDRNWIYFLSKHKVLGPITYFIFPVMCSHRISFVSIILFRLNNEIGNFYS